MFDHVDQQHYVGHFVQSAGGGCSLPHVEPPAAGFSHGSRARLDAMLVPAIGQTAQKRPRTAAHVPQFAARLAPHDVPLQAACESILRIEH